MKKVFSKKSDIDKHKTEEYMRALVYIARGHIFNTVAKNGFAYLYFVSSVKSDMGLAEYIFQQNGIYPFMHNSRLYHGEKVVLRIPHLFLMLDKHASNFIDNLMYIRWQTEHKGFSWKEYKNSFENILQEKTQNTK